MPHPKYRPPNFSKHCQKIRILVCPIHCHVLYYHHSHFRPTMSCFTDCPAVYAVIAFTYVFIHCNFLVCCCIFRHAGDDDYSGDHDDYSSRGDDDCRSADIRTLCSPVSIICINKKTLTIADGQRDAICQTRPCLLLHNSVGTTSVKQSINQLYFRQTNNKTAVSELNTATLSDWATRQTFCTNSRPENPLIQ